LSIEDALALRRARHVLLTDPIVQGNADIEYAGKGRRVTLYGTGPDFPRAFSARVASGQYLPADDPREARALVVLGAKAAKELFGAENPLGARVRVGTELSRGQGDGIEGPDAHLASTTRVHPGRAALECSTATA
jgi:putative ABC transport system permease protein